MDRLYDIPLEVARLRELPESFHSQFLDGQMIGLLNEHAGYVPFSELEGELRQDGAWVMQGLDLQSSWQRTIEKYGHWSREHYEVIGYQEAYKMLLDQNVSMVVLSSPSKEGYGDRRFTFTFRKIPNIDGSFRIIQTNIMHRHDDVGFRKAQKEYDQMQQSAGFSGNLSAPETTEEMLVRPLAFSGSADHGRIYELLGLTQDKVDASEAFAARVRQDLGQYVQHFIGLMSELATVDKQEVPFRYAEITRAAKQARDYLFEQATLLRDEQDEAATKMAAPVVDGNLIDIGSYIAQYYGQHDAPLFYGSLVCDTQSSNMYIGLLGDMSPHMAAMYSVFGEQAIDREAWRDTSKWEDDKDCREFGKGGCGAKKVKIGPCAICELCQRDYDAGRKPSIDRSKKPIAKAA